jgi:hypothetical protein
LIWISIKLTILKLYFKDKTMTIKQKKLSEKAMLVNFTVSTWTGRVKDSQVSDEVMTNKNADSDSGAWWTYLIPKSALKEVTRAAVQTRVAFWKYTLPWQDGGCRILPSALFMEYTEGMRKATQAYDEAVSNFIKKYPEIIATSQTRLGKLSSTKALPSVATVRSRFGYRNSIFPLPSASDFRVDINDDDFAAAQKQVEDSIDQVTGKAMSSVWERFNELVGKVAETLKQPDKVFRDSLITNLSDFCVLLPKMNITDDNKLEQMRKLAVDKLANLKPGTLRDEPKERKTSAKDAKELLNKLKEYGM